MIAMISTAAMAVRRKPVLSLWMMLLLAMVTVGAVSIVFVLVEGLKVTNLTNALPWGLWITVDLSAIGLGAGAFTLSAAVYIFGLKKYEAIARAAVFIGLLGYSSAMLALFVDIGRPDRFYHPVLYWNPHSVLWEITMCVILYTTVLLLEFIPIVLESRFFARYGWAHTVAHLLHRVMPVVALAGLGLSLLHQSSLGATYGVLTARPVWYSPSAPVLFILSAAAAGPALTMLVTLIAGEVLKKRMVPTDVLHGVARFVGFASLAYLYLKLWSWAATNYYSHVPAQATGIELLKEHTPYDVTFWWGEVLMGALLPAIIFLWPRLRRNRYLLMLGALMVVAGLVINRWNMTLSGFTVPLDWSPGVLDVFGMNRYSPTLVEWGVAVGIVGYTWLAFTLGVRYLSLYPQAVRLVRTRPAPAPVPASEPFADAAPAGD
ncbi:MAG: polysulfide reductase NrfD [Chloroflexi bacterium]|nr:polysulfide reductase NrfD [Chloroflexota bacterium]